MVSLLASLLGLLASVLGARRVAQGIGELREKNRSLELLQQDLSDLNSSLDARVAATVETMPPPARAISS